MICVDSSVAAKWALSDEVYVAEAFALLREALRRREPIVAPPLLTLEIANILCQRMRRDGLSLTETQERLHRFLALPVTVRTFPSLHSDALTLAAHYNLPATYDAHYVALARSLSATFWTADERLFNTLGDSFAFVHFIANYETRP